MQLNRRRLFACLAAAPVAAAMPAPAHAGYLPVGSWLQLTDKGWGGFISGFKAAQVEWEASGLFAPGKLAAAGIFSPGRADR